MAADYIIEMQEQENEEQNYSSIIDEAAHYVVNKKMSREEAFEHSKNLHEERQDKDNYVVTNEETGEIEYLHSELKEPIFKKTKQIEAVASELFEKFE
jgi:nitrogen regulatory protein PII-like uncharacterized protein